MVQSKDSKDKDLTDKVIDFIIDVLIEPIVYATFGILSFWEILQMLLGG